MDMEFLAQMRQSNKGGRVRVDEIFNLHLRSGAGPWVSIPCFLQDPSHIPSTQTTNRKKVKNLEMRSTFQQIISHSIGLGKHNQGLRETDMELSPKRGSNKISMDSYMVPALREVDVEPSAKRGSNRTGALVSLYWSSRSS